LKQDANRKVCEYSLGMRQRLGLAIALLNEPKLLILDEPTNGLDSAGIQEIRELIRRLPLELGVTIFLSSHLLNEVEQVATHIGIIRKGKILFQGALDDLQAKRQDSVQLGVSEPERAVVILQNAGWTVNIDADLLQIKIKEKEAVMKINKLLVEHGIGVFHLTIEQPSLEKIFLQLTNARETLEDE